MFGEDSYIEGRSIYVSSYMRASLRRWALWASDRSSAWCGRDRRAFRSS